MVALRNGAPFKHWVLPAAIERVRRKLRVAPDGDRQMVEILGAVLSDGLSAVEAACAEALKEGVHSADVILNILARRRDPGPPVTIMTPEALRLGTTVAVAEAFVESLWREGAVLAKVCRPTAKRRSGGFSSLLSAWWTPFWIAHPEVRLAACGLDPDLLPPATRQRLAAEIMPPDHPEVLRWSQKRARPTG